MIRDRRLHKSRNDKILFGVAGGTAEYFDIDPVLARVGWVALAIISGGFLILLYIVLAIIMPDNPRQATQRLSEDDDHMDDHDDMPDSEARSRGSKRMTRYILAVVLIAFGGLMLLNNLGVFSSIRWDIVWPIAIVGVGLAILVPSLRR